MAGSRKKAEFKQLQQGYAEVLENTQYALIATVHKHYAMVLASEPWTLPWPALNAHGQPVIHDIASKLGCIRADPTSSSTVPIKFPADAAEFAALQCKLESEERHDSRSGFEMVGLAGPESQFGNELFFGEFGEGFDGKFADVGKGYGVVVSTLQTRLSRQLQLASQQQEQEQQQQQQQQHPLRIQRAASQQMQQQGLDLWEAAWASASETEEQMRTLMRAEGLYNAGLGVGSTAGDGTVRPNLLEYGFCRGLHRGG
ncbi:Fluconazole resistance protein 1 [Pseudogymnoascus australis]